MNSSKVIFSAIGQLGKRVTVISVVVFHWFILTSCTVTYNAREQRAAEELSFQHHRLKLLFSAEATEGCL